MPIAHTPGPWRANGCEVSGPPDSGVVVARLPEWGLLADEPDPAPDNARLIASAPDLLRALSDLHIAVTTRPSGYQPGLSQAERVALDSARALLTRLEA